MCVCFGGRNSGVKGYIPRSLIMRSSCMGSLSYQYQPLPDSFVTTPGPYTSYVIILNFLSYKLVSLSCSLAKSIFLFSAFGVNLLLLCLPGRSLNPAFSFLLSFVLFPLLLCWNAASLSFPPSFVFHTRLPWLFFSLAFYLLIVIKLVIDIEAVLCILNWGGALNYI